MAHLINAFNIVIYKWLENSVSYKSDKGSTIVIYNSRVELTIKLHKAQLKNRLLHL